MVNKLSLLAKARELADKASRAPSGRAADTVLGGHEKRMRQTVVAMRAGVTLAETASPHEVTLLVISGRLWLESGDDRWSAREWGYLIVPGEPYSVVAETDATFLLTVGMA
ncbi:LuxR family transcriptional regulator [Pseudactinotalea sp. HY158]|uniref:LuxR family transcriptional regulator n=2 Tax=unclassified Pseudactinotalea TaxID=2649176 RepID=UPI00128D4B5B|nr:LuxR family transcriptional regulator [Pseudactinotalea sp. HY158]MPV49501.1 LuxR family transcriptional regulator [Pseudactinotalea sp. HY160]QGH69815.1 LuxR family transcriptional regulator [Pseudactinotalea sp. HY158]